MVKNSTNINKMNNFLSPQTRDCACLWQSSSLLGRGNTVAWLDPHVQIVVPKGNTDINIQ
jgi:hypothetical protein